MSRMHPNNWIKIRWRKFNRKRSMIISNACKFHTQSKYLPDPVLALWYVFRFVEQLLAVRPTLACYVGAQIIATGASRDERAISLCNWGAGRCLARGFNGRSVLIIPMCTNCWFGGLSGYLLWLARCPPSSRLTPACLHPPSPPSPSRLWLVVINCYHTRTRA